MFRRLIIVIMLLFLGVWEPAWAQDEGAEEGGEGEEEFSEEELGEVEMAEPEEVQSQWEVYKELYNSQQYQTVIDMCLSNRGAIEVDPANDIIYKYCGMSYMQLYEKSKSTADLTKAVDFLELSLAYNYSEDAAFKLGVARMKEMDTLTDKEDLRERELLAIEEMWKALRVRHAMEDFNRLTLSDGMLVWSKDFRDVLIERILKSEEDKARVRLLSAYLRMLADRFVDLDPTLGENDVRRSNLGVFRDWMTQLLELSYFDNNVVVGMFKYMGDRTGENYDQTDATEDQFIKSLFNYNEGLARAKNNKAKAVLYADIADRCSYYKSDNREKMVSHYKTGFTSARQGLFLMKKINEKLADDVKEDFPYEPDNADIMAKLQRAYGSNLTGLCYFHWLRKDYKSVVAMRDYAFDTGFDWEGKQDTFLIIADAADKLASKHHRDRQAFTEYKELCLFASSRAFKSILKKYKGKPPVGSDEFCRVLTNHISYLRRFGMAIEAEGLQRQYHSSCPGH